MPNEQTSWPAVHTAGIPRLYDQYVEAVANVGNPDRARALAILTDITERCDRAKACLTDAKKS